MAARLVELLAGFGGEEVSCIVGSSDDGVPQLEVSCRNRWLVLRALPGGRWWANGQRCPSTDVILREGTLSVVWDALLWVVGLRGVS